MDNGMIAAAAADDLAVAIRREHEAAGTAARAALDHALEAGRLLAEARQGIAHGGWETFVRERCGIAPRTARLYLQLDANRERLTNRQRVAGLTVREAARFVAEPRPEAVPQLEQGASCGEPRHDLPRLSIPEWYRPGHRHFGDHPAGWSFEVWPHPAGEPWVHYFILSATSGFPGDEGGTLVGPQRGIRVDAVEWSIELQRVNGMPRLCDRGWTISAVECDLDDAADAIADRFKPYNSLLFTDDDDYRRRGMGIEPARRKAAATA